MILKVSCFYEIREFERMWMSKRERERERERERIDLSEEPGGRK